MTVMVAFAGDAVSLQDKTTMELGRAALVFQLSAIKPLVRHSQSLLALGDRVMSPRFMDWFLKVGVGGVSPLWAAS